MQSMAESWSQRRVQPRDLSVYSGIKDGQEKRTIGLSCQLTAILTLRQTPKVQWHQDQPDVRSRETSWIRFSPNCLSLLSTLYPVSSLPLSFSLATSSDLLSTRSDARGQRKAGLVRTTASLIRPVQRDSLLSCSQPSPHFTTPSHILAPSDNLFHFALIEALSLLGDLHLDRVDARLCLAVRLHVLGRGGQSGPSQH